MEISNPHHQMIMSSHQFEELLGSSCPKLSTANNDHQHEKNNDNQGGGEKKPRPHPEQALKCPRCESSNTKFCYYNNYSLTQPRYFCKGCRRYWTQGGTLRNVPVGGGCRKNHKRSTSSSSSSPGNKNASIHKPSPNPLIATTSAPHSNPNQSLLSALSFDPAAPPFLLGPPNPNPNPNPTGFLDILRAGFLDQYSAAAAAASLPASGFNSSTSLYSYGVDGALLPLDGVLQGLSASSSATTTTTSTAAVAQSSTMDDGHENKVMMGHQWQFGNNDNNIVDYNWNGGAGSYWHGVINGSLM